MDAKQLPANNKEALKQSIKDDMEVWSILFNQLIRKWNNKNR